MFALFGWCLVHFLFVLIWCKPLPYDGLIRESEEEALKRRFKREKCKKICKSMQGLASHQNSKQPKNPKGLKEVSTSITVENCLILVFNCFKST